MTVPPHVGLVQRLGNDLTPSEQSSLLKRLKTEVIGHVEKKEHIVRHGVLDTLVRILANTEKSRGKRGYQESNGTAESHYQQMRWMQEDDVRLQVILLITSLANGGASFIPAISASNALPHLFMALSPETNPSRIIVAALKALLAVSDVADAAMIPDWPSVVQDLYLPKNIRYLAEILAQRSEQSVSQSQVALVARLINLTCTKEEHRECLLRGGVLDLLAGHIASFYAQRESWILWDESRHGASLATRLAPETHENIAHILGAVSAIVQHSYYRGIRLICSPIVNNVFSISPPDSLETHRRNAVTAVSSKLPRIPPPIRKIDEKNYPPLPLSQTTITEASHVDSIEDPPDETRHPGSCVTNLVNWLTITIRKSEGPCRIEAARLLTLLYQCQAVHCEQKRILEVVIIPCLLQELDDATETNAAAKTATGGDQMHGKERAIFTLAKLIKPSPPCQRAAVDAGSITKVSAMLRKTFGPLDLQTSHWSPSRTQSDWTAFPPSCRVLSSGFPPLVTHTFRIREAALSLLSAIADSDEGYRKIFIEAGMINVIKDCMEPLSLEAMTSLQNAPRGPKKDKIIVKDLGNPVAVLVAACDAARVMARSVSALRTSIIDAGLALPTFQLLSNANMDVVKAATDVVCNLNPEFSPVRQDLVNAGVIMVLCKHAHSADLELCHRSLWAIKHLICQAPNEVKIMCLEHLGTRRLKQFITNEPSSEVAQAYREEILASRKQLESVRRPLSHMNNMASTTSADELIADDQMRANESGTNNSAFSDGGDSIALDLLEYSGSPITSPELQRTVIEDYARDRIKAYNKYLELSLSIQRQSLDVVRNFIMGPKAPETIEFIFSRMSDPNIFEMVEGKIRKHRPQHLARPVKTWSAGAVTSPSPKNSSPEMQDIDTHPTACSVQILYSSIMILVHIAAGAPHQRQTLLCHQALMALLLSLLPHSQSQIRVAIVFVVQNLTWVDDDSDRRTATQRAADLQQMGFVEALQSLQQDENVDVRERVNTARTQLNELLDMGNSRSTR